MKHELNAQPACFKEAWPRQLEIFSWFDYITAIPQVMFVITTWKEGRIPNANLQAWATYTGDAGGYYIICSISNYGHTYKNILRDKEFAVNFPSIDVFPKCYETIKNNSGETDEITTSGLTIEPSKAVDAPRIKECFLNLECRLRWHRPLHDGSICHIFAGEVIHVAIDSNYVESGTYRRYGTDGFIYNIPPSKNPETGKQDDLMVGRIEPVHKIE